MPPLVINLLTFVRYIFYHFFFFFADNFTNVKSCLIVSHYFLFSGLKKKQKEGLLQVVLYPFLFLSCVPVALLPFVIFFAACRK